MIDITGLDKAEVLAALYNGSKPLGMGLLHYAPEDMTPEEAQQIISERGDDSTAMFGPRHGRSNLDFDYLKGRVMKVKLSGDSFDPWLYDRDNGEGAAARAIEPLRSRVAA